VIIKMGLDTHKTVKPSLDIGAAIDNSTNENNSTGTAPATPKSPVIRHGALKGIALAVMGTIVIILVAIALILVLAKLAANARKKRLSCPTPIAMYRDSVDKLDDSKAPSRCFSMTPSMFDPVHRTDTEMSTKDNDVFYPDEAVDFIRLGYETENQTRLKEHFPSYASTVFGREDTTDPRKEKK
jgi:hypothetical protein